MSHTPYSKEQYVLALQIETAYVHFAGLLRTYEQHFAPDAPVIRSIDMCMHAWEMSGLSRHIWNVRTVCEKGSNANIMKCISTDNQ